MSQAAGHSLDARVLVLNKFYLAVHIVSVRRAFCLLFKDLAEVITIDDGRHMAFDFASWREVSEARRLYRHPDDDFIRTVQFEIQVPRIIRLISYDRLPRQRVKFNRRNLFARDGNRCQYCGKKFSDRRAQPRSCRATQPWRAGDLGQYCLRLPTMQREKRRAHTPRSRHEADSHAHRTPDKPGGQPIAL